MPTVSPIRWIGFIPRGDDFVIENFREPEGGMVVLDQDHVPFSETLSPGRLQSPEQHIGVSFQMAFVQHITGRLKASFDDVIGDGVESRFGFRVVKGGQEPLGLVDAGFGLGHGIGDAVVAVDQGHDFGVGPFVLFFDPLPDERPFLRGALLYGPDERQRQFPLFEVLTDRLAEFLLIRPHNRGCRP